MSEAGPMIRLGVLDRGETAVRVLNAVGELNQAGDGPKLVTVLLHHDSHPLPWYGREADDVRSLAAGTDARSADVIVAALRRAQVDTLWLGESPAPRADLIAACEAAGIAVVGPDAATVRRLADRGALAKLHPSGAPPAAGAPIRRIEVDILADRHGTVWVFGERDVTVRRNGRPLLIEAPCAIDAALAQRIRAAAAAIARAVGYRGAGVLHVAHDGANFAVEGFDTVAAPLHATTEERTGVSIIGWRLRVQRGEPLPAAPPEGEGCAMAALVLAEPAADTPPAWVALLKYPIGTGVRIDGSRRRGDPVDTADPLLAVVTAWGPDRRVALGRLRRALQRAAAVVEGGDSNRTLLLRLLHEEGIAGGRVDHRWLDRALAEPARPAAEPVVLLAAAVQAYEDDRELAQASFYAAAARGRPEQPADVGSRIELAYLGHNYRLEVDCVGSRSYSVRSGGASADISVDALGRFERRITCAGRRHRLLVAPTGTGYRIEADGSTHVVGREDGVVVSAGRPALVVAMLVKPGAQVAAGDPIAVLESMKMESTVSAPMAGEIVSVSATAHAQVEAAAPLVRLRPHPAAAAGQAEASRVELAGLEQPTDFTAKPCERAYGPLGEYLLGYDLPPAALRRLLTEQRRMAEIAEPGEAALLACEDGLLDIYADLGALYRPQTEAEPDELVVHTGSTQEHFVAFLQWLDADRAGLPADYRLRLQRALGRFGVDGLARTPALESALMRLFRSFGRLAELAPVVTAILQRWIAHRDVLVDRMGAAGKARLGRLVAATQGRQQAIADLARDVSFHFFDEPQIEAADAELRTEMAGHLAALARQPGAGARAHHLERLLRDPQPIRSLLLDAWRGDAAGAELRRVVLEVHIRRVYRICRLGEIAFGEAGGSPFAGCDYAVDGEDARLVVGYLPLEKLPEWSVAVAPQLAAIEARRPLVVELATWRDGPRQDLAETAAQVGGVLAACRFGRRPARVNVALTSAGAPRGEGWREQSFTFDPADDGALAENPLHRDLHPMLARRLEIWRLSNFELERRPSPPDVHLFLGVARSNREDRRLFALAEIRDLEPAVDPATGATSYPRLQRTGVLAMAAMRSELSRYAQRDRPAANRLVLDVRAPWDLPASHVEALANHFAPLAARAGLEKVVLKLRRPDAAAPGGLRDGVMQFEAVGNSVLVTEGSAGAEPIRPRSSSKDLTPELQVTKQLRIDCHNDRGRAHRDGPHTHREIESPADEQPPGDRDGDEVVRGRPHEILDHLPVGRTRELNGSDHVARIEILPRDWPIGSRASSMTRSRIRNWPVPPMPPIAPT